MKKISLNQDWKFRKSGAANITDITLPHDAMILEERDKDAKNGATTGFYPGGTYTYTKDLFIPMEWKGKDVILEFEGVQAHAVVYINNSCAASRPYGYSNFYVNCNDFLCYGEVNSIAVNAKTGMEKISRWYTGSGIYRDVWLYVGDTAHIAIDGVAITTPDVEEKIATIQLNIAIENTDRNVRNLRVLSEVLDKHQNIIAKNTSPITAFSNSKTSTRMRFWIESPNLWSCENPYLYECRVSLLDDSEVIDTVTETFGIRKLQLDIVHGLRINGEMVKLRGACIHHDNGVIGSATLPKAEQRRVMQLKEAGFNCLRSAHHPMSKAMLNACDRLGMLVMDEAFDMWENAKTDHDYSLFFPDWWEQDVEAMVLKDRNHPCVIIYSIGNEIGETGKPSGARINRMLANKIRSIDDTRYITNGINGMNSNMEVMDKITQDVSGGKLSVTDNGDRNGSNELNSWLTILSGGLFEQFMAHPLVAKRTEEAFSELDIAGFNYLSGQYENHHKLYPNRIMIGSETFPADIAELWRLVKKHNYVIGDMTWAGYDYLGEAGCGIHYYDDRENFNDNWPDRLAYVGDIDITGYRRPLSYLREIVYGLRIRPYIAVERVNRYGQKHSTTPWIADDDIASWTWPGYEGKPANINVFSPSDEVELLLNGKSVGKQPAGKSNGYKARFESTYQPGELVAVGYTNGQEDGRMRIQTAKSNVHLDVRVNTHTLKADGADLGFVSVELYDDNGIHNLWESREVSLKVEGLITLQGFGSALPQGGGNYFDTKWPTYDGRVLAVVRAGFEQGVGRLVVTADGCEAVVVGFDLV